MDIIKLLDVSSPKTIKDTLNSLIEHYTDLEADINATVNSTVAKAEESLSNSETAVSTAERAEATASNATNTASNALEIAEGIDAKATEALSKSEEAVSTANTASAVANGIDAKATEALSKSEEAVSTANTASAVANGIDAKATEALTEADRSAVLVNTLQVQVNNKVNFVDNLTTTTNLPQLNMNRLTEEELASAKDEGTLNANELYMTEDVTEDDTKANVDASNLSDTNVESWRDKLGKGKMLYYEHRYNVGTVFNGHDTLFTTTINSPTNSVLVYLNYCDSLSHKISWVKITLGKQESQDLASHDYTTNNSWKSAVWVFNNVPKNTDLTLSIALYSQEDSVTITLPAYNKPECLVVSI